MKALINLLKMDENFKNAHKEMFMKPFLGVISKGKKFIPKNREEALSVKKSLIGHFNKREFAIAIWKDDKYYTLFIPNIEFSGYLDYTIEEYVYFEIFGYSWEVAELTKTQEEKIWNIIKDYEFENNIIEEIY